METLNSPLNLGCAHYASYTKLISGNTHVHVANCREGRLQFFENIVLTRPATDRLEKTVKQGKDVELETCDPVCAE